MEIPAGDLWASRQVRLPGVGGIIEFDEAAVQRLRRRRSHRSLATLASWTISTAALLQSGDRGGQAAFRRSSSPIPKLFI